MFVWLLDLGNSRLKWSVAERDALGTVHALAHAGIAGGDEALSAFEEALVCLFEDCAAGTDQRSGLLASVAPDAVRERVESAAARVGVRLQRVVTEAECAGVRVAYPEPARLGVDRFLALLAAHARGGDWMLVSLGSALTIDLLDAHGHHHGGLIGIMPAHAESALKLRFPALDRGTGQGAAPWAMDTPDAVAAGVRRQSLGMVMAAFADAEERLGRRPGVLIGGGDAAAAVTDLQRRLPVMPQRADALVLDGLLVWARARI